MCTSLLTVCRSALRIAVVIIGTLSLPTPAPGQTFVWDGGLSHGNFTVNNLWSTSNNWIGGSAPISGMNTDVAFTTSGNWTTASQNISSPFLLHSISFDASNDNFFEIAGGGLDFHTNASSVAPLINQNCGVAITIANAVNLSNSLTIQGTGSGFLTLGGALSGAGGLTKNGSFALLLGADNSNYGGAVAISAGSIVLGNANALAGSTVTMNVNNGLNLNGLVSASLGALAGAGNIVVGSTATVLTVGSNNATTTYSGTLTGAATDLVKAGTGALTLTGAGSSIHGLAVSNGSVVLDGGTTFTATSNAGVNGPHRVIEIGNSSNAASLTVQGGSTLDTSTATEALLGLSTATQTMTVQGAGTLWKLPSQTDVGGSGTGTLIVQNGAQLIGGNFLDMANSGTGTVQVLSGGKITTASVFISFGGTGTLTVSGTNSSLSATTVTLANDGGTDTGTLTISAGGSVTTNSLMISSLTSSVTVNGGTLSANTLTQIAGATIPIAISDPVGGSALTIGMGGGLSSIVGPITDGGGGPGTVVKIGAGILKLSGHLTNTGGYVASAGTIDFSGALVQPLSGSLSASPGAVIDYDNGARIFGGFLIGPGTHTVNGASFSGTSASNSAVINVTGAGTFTNFSNSGSLSVVAGNSATPSLSSFINQGSGSITIGAGSAVNAADFQSYGLLTINTATAPAMTQLTNTGTTPLSFNGGSRTFIGTPGTAGTFVAGIDLHGQNAIVAGGLFVNNGYVIDSTNSSAVVVADYGALVKGAGFYLNSPITQNGGRVQAGNSPGSASFGQLTFGPGGVSNYLFAIDDATGTAGPSPNASGQVSGWGMMKAVRQAMPPVRDGGLNSTSGDFSWTADASNKLTFAIETLVNPTTVGTDVSGLMADFDPSRSYSWPAVQWSGTYSGPTDVARLDASTIFDTTGFENPITGTFGWSIDPAGQTLSLTYTPGAVPEPGTFVLTALAGLGLAKLRWRHLRGRT